MLTNNQYQELLEEVMLFAKIGELITDVDVIWSMCIEEMKELKFAIEDLSPSDTQDSIADTFVTLAQLYHYHFGEFEDISEYEEVTDILTVDSCIHLLEIKDRKFLKTCMGIWYTHALAEASRWGFNLYNTLKAVNKSNFTKYPPANMVLKQDTSLEYSEQMCMVLGSAHNRPYKDVLATISFLTTREASVIGSDKVVVYRENNGKGKVVKHFSFFKEPDFTEVF